MLVHAKRNRGWALSRWRIVPPEMESLEGRLLLNAAPVFAMPLESSYAFNAGGALTIGVDGLDADGDPVTITAVSDTPGLVTYIPQGNRYARLHFRDAFGTPMGAIEIQLFDDRSPTATDRFATLSQLPLDPGGLPFYTDVIVHRVIDNFMFQTGDAANGDGTGGSPFGPFDDAFDPYLRFAGRGVVAMANSGPDTNDCQFFITDAPTAWLNQVHMIFGQVISGWDVYEAIITQPTDANDRPLNPPVMSSVEIFDSIEDATITFLGQDWFTGDAHVTVTLDDGQGGVTQQTVTVTFTNPDTAPVLATSLQQRYYFSSDGALTIGVDGLDMDGDALTITAISGTPGLTAYIPQGNRYARLHFNTAGGQPIGAIEVQLFDDRSPTATDRFVTLSQVNLEPANQPFYTDVVVHRVIDNFMFQTGDAANGDGTGGSPFGDFDDAFDPVLSFAGPGILAMANSGPDTNDCQFFVTDAPTPWLNQRHMIFGQLISGWDVYQTIITQPTDDNDRPLAPPVLTHVEIFSSTQDATITFQAVEDFVGDAQVTVRLDDGEGHVTEQPIVVTYLGDRPTIDAPDKATIGPGQTDTIHVPIQDDGNATVQVTFQSTAAQAQVTYDPDTDQLTVTSPAGFSGVFAVTLQAVEEVPYQLTPTSRTVLIFSQNADDPQILSHSFGPNQGSADGAFQVGDRLYVAMGDAGLAVYDLSDPAAPDLLGTYDTPGSARSVEVVGTVAYVADTDGGLLCLNVADPANVQRLDGFGGYGPALSLILRGNRAYVAEAEGGLTIYDVSDPADIGVLGHIAQRAQGSPFGAIVGVALWGNFAFLSDYAGAAIHVVDITLPFDPRYLTSRTAQQPWGMCVSGNYLYVADVAAGLRIYDVSVPIFPQLLAVANLASWGPGEVTIVDGTNAVVGGGTGTVILDVVNPRSPAVRYALSTPDSSGRAAAGATTLAVPIGEQGLLILDAGDFLGRPMLTGTATFIDDGGVPVTITAKGASFRAFTTGPQNGTIERLEIFPQSPKAVVKITAPGGSEIDRIVVGGSLKSFLAPDIVLTGRMEVTGSLGRLQLGDVDAQHEIVIQRWSNFKESVSIVLGDVTDLSIRSAMPIALLSAKSWADTDATADVIDAPSISRLTVAGDFQAGLDLDGTDNRRYVLGGAAVGGAVSAGQWQVQGNAGKLVLGSTAAAWTATFTGSVTSIATAGGFSGTLTARSLGSLRVGADLHDATLRFTLAPDANNPKAMALGSMSVTGWMTAAILRAAGNVGNLRLGGMRGGSAIFAGVKDAVTTLPDGLDDFFGQAAIARLDVLGIAGQAHAFINSNVAARRIGRVALGQVRTDNSPDGGADFGLAADELTSLRRQTDAGVYVWPNRNEPQGPAPDGDFVVRIL